MLEAYNSIVVYDSGMEGRSQDEPAYAVIAHNLTAYDARILSERLAKQFDLHAHTVKHRNYHSTSPAQDCDLCQLLFEEIVERAAKARRESATQGASHD